VLIIRSMATAALALTATLTITLTGANAASAATTTHPAPTTAAAAHAGTTTTTITRHGARDRTVSTSAAAAVPLPGVSTKPIPATERSAARRVGSSVTSASYESANWSGYAVSGNDGSYTSISADWIEPTVTCTTDGLISFWVGLDGYNNTSAITSDTVEQTGTGVSCQSGSPVAYAWWETFPANQQEYTSVAVEPDDHLSAEAEYVGGGNYDLVLTDQTQGWSKTTQVAGESGYENKTAEAITEATSEDGVVTALPEYTPANDTNPVINGGDLLASEPDSLEIESGSGQIVSTPGPDDSFGDFTTDYGSSAPLSACEASVQGH
jgi:hypothetical protein